MKDNNSQTGNEIKIQRHGHYRYSIFEGGFFRGLVTVCRTTDRSQYYQVELPGGARLVIKEFPSVRKASLAAVADWNK